MCDEHEHEHEHEDEVLVEEDRQCGLCEGPMQLMGMLGCMMHFRCRNCGKMHFRCRNCGNWDYDEGGCG